MSAEEMREITEHEGERYLELLGLSHLADHQIPGRTMRVRDFLEVCGEHARPMLVGLESLDPADPRFELTRDMLRSYVAQFIEPQGQSSG